MEEKVFRIFPKYKHIIMELVGKKIEYTSYSGEIRRGTIEAFFNKNVMINGEYIHVSNIYKYRIVEEV